MANQDHVSTESGVLTETIENPAVELFTISEEVVLTAGGAYPADPAAWQEEADKADGESWVVVELSSLTDLSDALYCPPIRLIPKPTIYTVHVCGKNGYEDPLTEIWAQSNYRDEPQDVPLPSSFTELYQHSLPRLKLQLLNPLGRPLRLDHRYEPWISHGTVDPDTPAKVLLDLNGPSGHHQWDLTGLITSVALGKVLLDVDLTSGGTTEPVLGPGRHLARFTCIWLDRTISVPTIPLVIHVEETFTG